MHSCTRHLSASLTPLCVALFLAGCNGNGSSGPTSVAPPAGLGAEDTAPVQNQTTVLPYVDFAYTNQRGDARYATVDTNAGVRVVSPFLTLWKPSTLIVDAGVTAAANGSFPAITPSTWTGIPGDASDGTKLNGAVLDANVQYVINATSNRTNDQPTAAYFDDRRGKGYSVTDGLGPLTTAWRNLAQQTTTITSVPADATTKLYNDSGNNTGVGSQGGNTTFGTVVDFINSPMFASTEPAKRFYKYARPWRWSNQVIVAPSLVPAESSTPGTDSGYISGHAAEGMRDALAMAYVLPERYQELVSRALELGENRIFAGMHSPLDVMAGRVQAEAVLASMLYAQANQKTTNPDGSIAAVADLRAQAYQQAHTALITAAGVNDQAGLNALAHSSTISTDRFADHDTNQSNYLRRLTYGFPAISDATKAAVVPKAAEMLLETRLPYLTTDQRRVVLKTTALTSGYPALDDAEGWGRLNLFAAADGYGNFNGDVNVNMDASQGGFNANDTWRNNIAGAGRLKKSGTGTLHLAGNNSYSGGTLLVAGTLEADSASAFGTGDVYNQQGTVISNASGAAIIAGNFTQLAGGSLTLDIGSNGKGTVAVSKTAFLGGALTINFANGFVPANGATLNVITANNLVGSFSSVAIPGYKFTVSYTSNGVQIQISGTASS